ncbi:MAG: pantetheine-phosphate adenylyltransferase [Clostridia bacterium]|nr:pantetheine-phosphate adenylyltransferase [Clostridia bacterium]
MTEKFRSAIIPGSFDPVTIGHLDMIERAAAIFDTVYVTALHNAEKKGSMFTGEEKLHMLNLAIAHLENVACCIDNGMTATFAKAHHAVIVKGVRNSMDFDYEMGMYGINRAAENIETIFIPAKQEHMHISSSFIREMLRYHHDFRGAVPDPVYQYLTTEWSSADT